MTETTAPPTQYDGLSADAFWSRIAPHLRRYLGLCEVSLEEGQRIYDAAEEEPLSERRIQEIMDYVKKCRINQMKLNEEQG